MKLKYFKEFEFKMGDVVVFDKMDPLFLEMLDDARDIAGVPFEITSSFRSAEYNEQIGGSKHSAHLRGKAADIACVNSGDRWQIVKALLDVGFRRIGIGKTFIHVDKDESLPQNVMWLY